jgi:hypothetical protein
MRYEKPEVNALAPALESIQACDKSKQNADGCGTGKGTTSAYEADE